MRPNPVAQSTSFRGQDLPPSTPLPRSDLTILPRAQVPVTPVAVSVLATSETTTFNFATPPRAAPTTATGMESPLSEVDDTPLTPVTNHRGKPSVKARGKRPVPADAEAGLDISRAKKSKRTRK